MFNHSRFLVLADQSGLYCTLSNRLVFVVQTLKMECLVLIHTCFHYFIRIWLSRTDLFLKPIYWPRLMHASILLHYLANKWLVNGLMWWPNCFFFYWVICFLSLESVYFSLLWVLSVFILCFDLQLFCLVSPLAKLC